MDNFFDLFFLNSAKMAKIRAIIQKIAKTDVNILVEGESGSGKEAVSRVIHAFSDRSEKPLVRVNCAAIPKNLLESELFGFEKGAFTGAQMNKAGKFELAHHGTMVLNEIGDIDFSIQAKLLQVLQDGVFFRLGGDKEVQVKACVITTTGNHLEEKVADGSFREDLFYRINVVNIHLPPLRDRKEQIIPLSRYYLDLYQKKYKRSVGFLSPGLLKALRNYSWPGNIRELENTIKGLVLFNNEETTLKNLSVQTSDATQAKPVDFSRPVSSWGFSDSDPFNLKEATKRAVKQAEKEIIFSTLTQTNWNRKLSSKLLQVSYKALLYKIQQYQLDDSRSSTGPKSNDHQDSREVEI
jgi:two-component system, NtrC family, response regulator AtoC